MIIYCRTLQSITHSTCLYSAELWSKMSHRLAQSVTPHVHWARQARSGPCQGYSGPHHNFYKVHINFGCTSPANVGDQQLHRRCIPKLLQQDLPQSTCQQYQPHITVCAQCSIHVPGFLACGWWRGTGASRGFCMLVSYGACMSFNSAVDCPASFG